MGGGVPPGELGRPPGRGPQGQGPAERRAVGVDVVEGREEGPDGGDLERGRGRGPGVAGDHQAQGRQSDWTVGQCQLGLLLHRSSPARDPTVGSGRRTRLGQACRSSLNQAITKLGKSSPPPEKSPRPRRVGGRWPSGSARGGWTAAAYAAPTTRGSRPSSPTGASGGRPPCR